MKKILAILSIAMLFAACKPGTEQKASSDFKTDILQHINGTWVMTEYLSDLQQTKSPLASSKKLTGVVTMVIEKNVVQGDSLPVIGSLNNHEGLSFYIIFKQGQTDKQVATDFTNPASAGNFYEVGYVDNDTSTIVLYEYDKDKKPVSQRKFTRVTGPLTDDSEPYGLQYMVNKTLVAGVYDATDDKGKKMVMEFTQDGILKGVEGHNTYYVFTDFIAEQEGYIVDELVFDEQTKNQKPFIFKISADTILLHAAIENTERTKLDQGPLMYTLVKKK